MQPYSEKEICDLHADFRELKKYGEKLAFFDRNFGIIPFSFPGFDPHLSFFFHKDKMETLAGIFKMERNNPELTEKKFSYGDTFVFSIRPANSNSSAYSNFILSRFIAGAPEFGHWIKQQKPIGKLPASWLEEANGILNHIEFRLLNEYDKSFRLQCMSVFYKGYLDAFKKTVNLPGKKRKFTELYLYAQGIIYAHYIRFLKTEMQKAFHAADLPENPVLDFSGKLALLDELGILEFLKNKFSRLDPFSFESKIAEFIRLITSENREHVDILHSIEQISQLKSDFVKEKTKV